MTSMPDIDAGALVDNPVDNFAMGRKTTGITLGISKWKLVKILVISFPECYPQFSSIRRLIHILMKDEDKSRVCILVIQRIRDFSASLSPDLLQRQLLQISLWNCYLGTR